MHIVFLVAALNDLNILSCDIQNAYLTVDRHEQIYIIAGPEFGSEASSIMLVKKALYGLKSSSTAFHAHLAETLYDLSFILPPKWIRMFLFSLQSSLMVSSIMKCCLSMLMMSCVFLMMLKLP